MNLSLKSIGFDAAATILTPSILSRLHAGQLAILTYHGVVETPQSIPDPCMVPIEEFRRQMHFLRDNFEVLPLDEALRRCRDRRVQRPIVAITFDDGYQSNHDLALPVLEKLGLPATIYLTTGFLDTDTTIWTGLLQHAFTVTRLQRLEWRGRQWELDSVSARGACLREVKRQIKSQSQTCLFAAVTELTQLLTGSDRITLDASSPYRMLGAASLQRLAKSDRIQLGAHTHQHFVLSRIEREMQRSEIRISKQMVESLTSKPCRFFAYPNGKPEDFNDDTIAILGDCGFEFAVTTIEGLCNASSFSPLRLPRLSVNGQSSISQFKLGLFNVPGRLGISQ
jgi:peptidoglycan/xylan/chitin deacetylase (PgdA/CDA1 family)